MGHAPVNSSRPCRFAELMLLLVLLAACGAPAPVQFAAPAGYAAAATRTDFATYHDPDFGYTLALPKEWYIGRPPDPQQGIVVASSREPAQPRSTITVLIEPAPPGVQLDQAIGRTEATLRDSPGIRSFKLDLARHVTVNHKLGEERLYSYQFDQIEIHQRSFYFGGEDGLYVVSYIAPKELYVQDETLFADVIASWQAKS